VAILVAQVLGEEGIALLGHGRQAVASAVTRMWSGRSNLSRGAVARLILFVGCVGIACLNTWVPAVMRPVHAMATAWAVAAVLEVATRS
jgi:hypothetical protein